MEKEKYLLQSACCRNRKVGIIKKSSKVNIEKSINIMNRVENVSDITVF